MNLVQKFLQKGRTFFERPISPAPLGFFRIAIAAFVLLQAALWYQDWLAFFGPDAWVQWEISRAMSPKMTIHISLLYRWAVSSGISAEGFVMDFFWVYVVCAAGLLAGYYTRVWAILTWFCHYVLMCSIDVYAYGVDIFLQIALFYVMVMPVRSAFSLDVLLRGISTAPSWKATMSIRVLQIHMCLIYISAGSEKMLARGWWDGNVLWRALVQPDFKQYNFTWLAHYPWLSFS